MENLNMRNNLLSKDKISLYNSNNIKTTFVIIECIGEGGSSVCYSAKNITDNKRGRLKELYPHSIDLNRNSKNNLIVDNSSSYSKEKHHFLNAYELLNQIQVDRTDDILNNFIPNSILFYSNKNSNGAIYVWTEYDYSGITFEDYLLKILDDTSIQPAIKVSNILNCIFTLTKCINYLHSVGLLHNDIKPANFLVLFDANGNINPHAISLFDINSISKINDIPLRISISKGFTAPEVIEKGKISVKSDIYSIGAMLFYSLVFIDNKYYQYNIKDHNNIKKFLDKSDILFNIPLPFLVHEFIEELEFILKKCLNSLRSKRYKDCTILYRDLNNLLVYLMDEVAREEAENIVKYRDKSTIISTTTDKLARKYNIKTNDYDSIKKHSSDDYFLTIIHDSGKKEEVEIIFSFEFSDNHREFLIYTKNEADAHDNITLYVSSVIRGKNGPELFNVSDEDWPRIVDLLNELGQEHNFVNSEEIDKQSNPLVDEISNKITSFSSEYNIAINLLKEQKYKTSKAHLEYAVKLGEELLQIYMVTKSTEYNATLKKVASSLSYLAFCYSKKDELYEKYLLESSKKFEEYSKNTKRNKELKLIIYPKLIELYTERNDIEKQNIYRNKLINLL